MTQTPDKSGPPGPWITKRQAADRLQVSLDTIERMIRDDELRVRRVRTLVRVHVDDVDGAKR